MYFWNDKKLADELKAGAIGETESFWYFFVCILATALFSTSTVGIFAYNSSLLNLWDYISDLIYLGTVVGGLFIYHAINQKGDNRDFIKRYTCLSVPVLIRAAIFFFIPYFILILCISIIFENDCELSLPKSWCEQYVYEDITHSETTHVDFALSIAAILYCFVRLNTLFKRINGAAS